MGNNTSTTKNSNIQDAAGSTEDEKSRVANPLSEYNQTSWMTSSQHAADLYDLGVELWTKENLADIEKQLAESFTTEYFTVRRIDGSALHIENPMFGAKKPIW